MITFTPFFKVPPSFACVFLFFFLFFFYFISNPTKIPGKATIIAFITKLALNYSLTRTEPLGYERFRLAWNGFVGKLKFDDKKAFTCEACGAAPTTVLFDATLLACRKDFMSSEVATTNSKTQSNVGSAHRARVLLNKNQQKAVAAFSSSTEDNPFSRTKLEACRLRIEILNVLQECCVSDWVSTFF